MSSAGRPSAVLEHQPCERRDGANLGQTHTVLRSWRSALRAIGEPSRRSSPDSAGPCHQARGGPAVEAGLEARALGKSGANATFMAGDRIVPAIVLRRRKTSRSTRPCDPRIASSKASRLKAKLQPGGADSPAAVRRRIGRVRTE